MRPTKLLIQPSLDLIEVHICFSMRRRKFRQQALLANRPRQHVQNLTYLLLR